MAADPQQQRGSMNAILARVASDRAATGAPKSESQRLYERVHGVRAMEKARKRAGAAELAELRAADPFTAHILT